MSNSSVAGTELSISTVSSSCASPTMESGYECEYEPGYNPEKGCSVPVSTSENNR
jgi:hypothetical protein